MAFDLKVEWMRERVCVIRDRAEDEENEVKWSSAKVGVDISETGQRLNCVKTYLNKLETNSRGYE